ncbi:MAG: Crp/Fnr family transcriptional regulator [Sulfurovum sp.]|nr:MAG: Crp/Fnr family transcriptional regulator [Sulfurovum sp.]
MRKLKEISLFSTLDEEALDTLQSDMIVHHYKQNSIVFFEGDRSIYLHILLEGEVKLYKTSPKGTQIHMHNFIAPNVIALFAAIEEIPFPATCEFVHDGMLGLIPLEKIQLYRQNVNFSISLSSALSKRMKMLSNVFHKETIFTSEAKIADMLLHNTSVFSCCKNNEIASILNMTPETLSRILSKLKKKKLISIKKHVVTLHNKIALQKVIETNAIEIE